MNASPIPRAANPLERLANAAPSGLVPVVAVAAKLAAAAIAASIAVNQSYDETQVFAACVAVVGLLTALPGRGTMLRAWNVFGAAMLTFAGALLFNVSIGPLLLLAGAVALSCELMANHQRGGSIWRAVIAIAVAMPAITALVLAIVFVVGG
ncbi:MAG: hypothetical protein ABIP13_01960 [Tepidiformaceae bacterium]